ncbi:MAG: VOC family protein [Pseudomonadales bacterium]
MSKAAVRALGYLELGVSSLANWEDFARDILGVQANRDGNALNLRYDADCWRLRLVQTGEDDIRCAGFEAADSAHLQAIVARLQAQGVAVSAASADAAAARRVSELVCLNDPFGLPMEIYVGDRSAPGAFESPRGVAGFVTAGQGLGHIVLTAPEPDRMKRFALEGLGFLLSDNIFMGPPGHQLEVTFLHCNPRHHTLAFAAIPASKRLNHIMLQLQDLDDVGRGLDTAARAGVPISSSLGRHTNDRMTSFYMRSPSGFDIEYGFGGVEIDDATWQPEVYHAPSIWGHRGALNPA